MLSKDAKAAFRIIKRSPEKKMSYRDIEKAFSWDFDKTKSVCQLLFDAGLATEKYHHPLHGGALPWGPVLTEKGRNSIKFFWFDVSGYVFSHIVVPLIVSIIAAIVTSILTTRAILS